MFTTGRATLARLSRALVAGALGVGLLGIGLLAPGAASPAAAAATNGVLVSTDGVHFASSLPAALFPSKTVMIPGAVQTATLYVMNDSTVPSQLFVSARDVVASSPEFARALTLGATGTAAPARKPAALDFAGSCVNLLSQPLAPRAVTRLTLALAMSDVIGQVAQGATIAATLGLALREADTRVAPLDSCDLSGVQLPVLGLPVPASGWNLAFTGSTILYPALMVVSVLLATGTWLVLAGRRRRRPV